MPRARQWRTWRCGNDSLRSPMRAMCRPGGCAVTTAIPTTSAPMRSRTRRWCCAPAAKPDARAADLRSGQRFLDFDQLEACECQIRAVLVEQRDEEEIRMARQCAHQLVARTGRRDDFLDVIRQ